MPLTILLPQMHQVFVTIFAGCALYINLVEHPARMTLPIEYAVTQWAPSYKRAAALQASLAASSMLLGLVSYFLLGAGVQFLISALLMFLVFAFTMVAIMPTNKKLLALKTMEEKKQKHVRDMMVLWNRLHGVRTLASLIAVVVLNVYSYKSQSSAV